MEKSTLETECEFEGSRIVNIRLMEIVTTPEEKYRRKFHDLRPEEVPDLIEKLASTMRWVFKR